MEDEKILDLFFDRDESAIEKTSEKYGSYCHAIAFRILGNREDAAECVNDTWMRAWGAIPPARPDRLQIFLGKITRNLSLNLFEKRTAAKRGGSQTEAALDELAEFLPDDTYSPEGAFDEKELGRAINDFLGTLKPSPRRLFVRRYWYMDSIRAIAQENGMGESAVKMSLARTRAALKKYLEKEGISV